MDESKVKENNYIDLFKGLLISIISSLIAILIFAFLLKFIDFSDLTINIINQIIKVISIFLGMKKMLANNKEKGLLKGLLLGALYSIFTFAIFSILNNKWDFSLKLLFDTLFDMAVGSIFGTLVVNMSKK
jgi:putative membrane protein (TIGR04086 family)